MNTTDNKRKRKSKTKIEKTFVNLIQTKELHEITVSKICKNAKINRSTFYSNYLDIYDLAEKIQEKLEQDILTLYNDNDKNSKIYNISDYLLLFKHIKENQLFYKTYFKLGLDTQFKTLEYNIEEANKYYNNKNIDYHLSFFRSGLNSIIKLWLSRNCLESPEEMKEILSNEYQGKELI